MKTFTVILFCMLCIVVGCGPRIHEGRILSKEFVPAHTTMEFNPAAEIIEAKHHPDRWKVTIGRTVAGSLETATFDVDEDYYNRCKKGDWADFK